jgi:hypothetical protein
MEQMKGRRDSSRRDRGSLRISVDRDKTGAAKHVWVSPLLFGANF